MEGESKEETGLDRLPQAPCARSRLLRCGKGSGRRILALGRLGGLRGVALVPAYCNGAFARRGIAPRVRRSYVHDITAEAIRITCEHPYRA